MHALIHMYMLIIFLLIKKGENQTEGKDQTEEGYPLKQEMLASFSPHKYIKQRTSTETFNEEIETLRIRIFNLIMHEFDNMTCNVGSDTYRIMGDEQFMELKTTDKTSSGSTNIPTITSIKQF